MPCVLVTGATGFVGRRLCAELMARGCAVRGTLLPGEKAESLIEGVRPAPIEPMGPETAWAEALHGVETLVHLAARVHVMRETAEDPLKEFRRTNTEGTLRLARECARAGVRRLVFMSTIGVNGDESGNLPFTEISPVHPHNNYSISKLEAERGLAEVARETGLEAVILRAPLVYGPGTPGNFFTLLKAVQKGLPLPLASVDNRRSLLYVGNLAHALMTAASHPKAAGELYLVSDGEDVSTPSLIRTLAEGMEKKARLLPFPTSLLRLVGEAAGRGGAVRSLVASLQVDSGRIRQELDWQPIVGAREALLQTARWHAKEQIDLGDCLVEGRAWRR
ncbi:NAD-dependent epimerase/dehydratase family protein [Geomonas subterranea]|uniref:NAD-dependent epimerase/dehydratase family protein n=1 Tax=Geomonas subterranea TaxID=2847989 RepID=A0ABX8LHN2_9BACT|nr:NAD-dependent epimerase/dehydratase family protein [Geomonas subterranea]QXE91550.1 NAD-dependent epimerase/dehydratase family protein [Geomonas subterranea]QXM10361.1 NAD-dependent epimerase/dehydratase family protein [Geomonas subterranea]